MAAVRCEEQFLCSICLDLFTEPVTTPCGHNFCRDCLSQHWHASAPCRCPLCKELFHTRPELRVNTLLSEVVSQLKQEAGSRPEVSTTGEVSCDYCSPPKLKAVKSCLVCLSSYCERHLQPHLSVFSLKSHPLTEPVDNMEERMCPQHHKALELFCRSDQRLLCTMCALLQHKSHDFVSLKEESTQRKASLQQTQQQSHHMVALRRQKIQEIQSSVQLSERAADREKSTGLKVYTVLMESVQKSREHFLQELQDKQRQTQTQADTLIQQLEQEICELEQRSTETEQLLLSKDHLLFLQGSLTLPPTGLKDCNSVRLETQTVEGTLARALTKLRKTAADEVYKVLQDELKRVQQFAVDLTLDPDTANVNLSVSKDLKQVHDTDKRWFTDSSKRFLWRNVFTKQSFTSGRFYFEVQVKDKKAWTLGVAKESVERKNRQISLTSKNGYWCLYLEGLNCYLACTDPCVSLSLKCAPQKVGVFVDYDNGVVSFYDADTADLIYSFTDCCFREKLFPFLNPCHHQSGANSGPLILTAVKK